jgi:long-chain acyl-CoA synthetase
MAARPNNVPDWLALRASDTPQAPAYWQRMSTGAWASTAWEEVQRTVHNLALQLRDHGLKSGDRVAIMMPTCPEWEYCHLAVLAAGGVLVGLDGHDAPENIRHVLQTISPNVLLLASKEQAATLTPMLPSPASLVVTLEDDEAEGIVPLHDLLTKRQATDLALPTINSTDTATIIFTSGSTGRPKGIAYSHGQVCLAGEAILARFPGIGPEARFPCWLPLSNLFQRIINLCAVMLGAQCYFVQSPGDIVKRLPEIRPTLFMGVPRFYEKLYAGIQAEVAKRPWPIRQMVRLAWDAGARFHNGERAGTPPSPALKIAYGLADGLVLSRMRGMMGPDLKFMISGSAPMPVWLLERLHGLGWLVLEAYGISECIVPVANNTLEAYRFGSVGKPLPENEIKLAEDSELLVRGPGVFGGYYGQAGTDAAFEADGYFHTGDYARLDADGFLTLTGRKSEIFKTSTGRRVAPVPVEACLKRLPYVEHAIVLGRNRPVPVAILAIQGGSEPANLAAPPPPAGFLATIGRDIEAACAELPANQRPAGALVTRHSFSVVGGELTSNLKLKRNVIEEKFSAEIGTLYDALARTTDHSRCLIQEVV